MEEWEEALIATSRPVKSSYCFTKEQSERMKSFLGPELDKTLDIMTAKLEVIEKIWAKCNREIENTKEQANSFIEERFKISSILLIVDYLNQLTKEIKNEMAENRVAQR